MNGAVNNGIKDLANYIATKVEFCRTWFYWKSAAYALIAYQTAFLKTYYKEELFLQCQLNNNTNKLREFVDELKRLKEK